MTRVCPECRMEVVEDQPDPCWGELPGVNYACCGHGGTAPAYVSFANGVCVYFDGHVTATTPRCDVVDADGYRGYRPFARMTDDQIRHPTPLRAHFDQLSS